MMFFPNDCLCKIMTSLDYWQLRWSHLTVPFADIFLETATAALGTSAALEGGLALESAHLGRAETAPWTRAEGAPGSRRQDPSPKSPPSADRREGFCTPWEHPFLRENDEWIWKWKGHCVFQCHRVAADLEHILLLLCGIPGPLCSLRSGKFSWRTWQPLFEM